MICLWSAGAQASAPAEVRPFGSIACTPQEGVRFCPGSVATRVKTFDGVPLDVNVTLPAKRSRHLPLIIQLHGYGRSQERARRFARVGREGLRGAQLHGARLR